jgi:energy-coupling factor transporter ATP-binding protein EcfA2
MSRQIHTITAFQRHTERDRHSPDRSPRNTDGNIMLIRRKVGLVFQDPNDQLSVRPFRRYRLRPLHFGLKTQDLKVPFPKPSQASISAATKKIRTPSSIGERKRVAIASVLACEPEILYSTNRPLILIPNAEESSLK